MHLRPAAPEDAAAITALFLAARRIAMPYLSVLHTDVETRTWIETVVLVECRVTVAVEAGRIVGFAALRGDHLDHLYVAPDSQRAGVGGRLMAWAKTVISGQLSQFVFQRNTAARAFYDRNGFVLMRQSDGADNEEREPDAMYGWRSVGSNGAGVLN